MKVWSADGVGWFGLDDALSILEQVMHSYPRSRLRLLLCFIAMRLRPPSGSRQEVAVVCPTEAGRDIAFLAPTSNMSNTSISSPSHHVPTLHIYRQLHHVRLAALPRNIPSVHHSNMLISGAHAWVYRADVDVYQCCYCLKSVNG